jgi:hypothetical protein
VTGDRVTSSDGAGDAIDAVVEVGGPRWVLVKSDGGVEDEGAVKAGTPMLSGSFNPLHHGHEQLAESAGRLVGGEVVYELTVVNVDKPPLNAEEVRRRLRQFVGVGRVVLTRAPRFVEKARLFPGSSFVIGWDTAVRLMNARYYGGSESEKVVALEEMQAVGVRFVVGGRSHDGAFQTLDDTEIPPEFSSMFEGIPESVFRADVSSSELRGE